MTTTERTKRNQYDDLAPLFTTLADHNIPSPRRREVRATLVVGHLPVAEHIAHRFCGRGQPEEDLTQVATVGLINAVDRFDPGRGTDFLSFAVPTITGEVRRHFRDTGWSVRVPRRLQELHHAISQAVGDLGNELGRAPRPREIARRLDVPVEQVYEGMEVAHAYNAESLQVGGDSDDDNAAMALGDRLGVEEHGLADTENRVTLYPALAKLPDRERRIVIMRFFGNMTQTQIAQRIGISQMHVSRLLARSLTKLREVLSDPTPVT
ncbi:MAG TPA: RNA polymerase sigma factor SigF [Pseudonocardiaceae bacterium]|nr:RNA polymerase sigma factor SigF [Pseudonocardiaceae bacterium]